jgi:hypothetical protein
MMAGTPMRVLAVVLQSAIMEVHLNARDGGARGIQVSLAEAASSRIHFKMNQRI